MRLNFRLLLLLLLALPGSASLASETTLYQVTTLRAAPGDMPAMIDLVKTRKRELGGNMLIMRHSQGDHWDLMLMAPATAGEIRQFSYAANADFQHDFLAAGSIEWADLQTMSEGANLFHIEMFQAAHGQYDKLLDQRMMENHYLEATQRHANLIFETTFGSDVDLFTLGIYPDLAAFAADPDLPAEAFEKAAVDAGFKARSDIGFYLRRFLVGHQDTLASQIE